MWLAACSGWGGALSLPSKHWNYRLLRGAKDRTLVFVTQAFTHWALSPALFYFNFQFFFTYKLETLNTCPAQHCGQQTACLSHGAQMSFSDRAWTQQALCYVCVFTATGPLKKYELDKTFSTQTLIYLTERGLFLIVDNKNITFFVFYLTSVSCREGLNWLAMHQRWLLELILCFLIRWCLLRTIKHAANGVV